MCEIIPNKLYIGSIWEIVVAKDGFALNFSLLREKGINMVIDLALELVYFAPLDLHYHHFALPDEKIPTRLGSIAGLVNHIVERLRDDGVVFIHGEANLDSSAFIAMLVYAGYASVTAREAAEYITAISNGVFTVNTFRTLLKGAPKQQEHPTPRFVQACITSISFPKTLEDLLGMVKKHRLNRDRGLTDMEDLLSYQPGDYMDWTVPKWVTLGDIVFFYHTKKAGILARSLYKQAVKKYGQDSDLASLIKHQIEIADQYAGTIFGCAQVSGEVYYGTSELLHFGSRLFAPLELVHIFSYPLRSEAFADYVRIGQSTITPLYGPQFEGIKALLAEQNRLPDFLQNARFKTLNFRAVNQDNWPVVSSAPDTRFIHEAQLRAYLLDYLLNEVKDKGTPLLEECQCYRNGEQTGIADYFIKIHGHWIPVEAKLNILAERDILSQVAKYIDIDSFIPTKGLHRAERFAANQNAVCIIADQSGIYLTLNGRFFMCRPGVPMWKRKALNHTTVDDIRNRIQEIINAQAA